MVSSPPTFGDSRFPRLVFFAWILFVAKCAFLTLALPLWEGYDEFAHFARIADVAAGRESWGKEGPFPPVVQASLVCLPLPPGVAAGIPGAYSHDAYWTAAARPDCRGAAEPLASLRNYEATQPPLYYWLMAPIDWLASERPLADRVLWLRLASVLLASLTILLAYRTAALVSGLASIGTAAAVLLAVLPLYATSMARVGNESLATLTGGAAIYCLLGGGPVWVGVGCFGLALLTKAYFLAAAPVVVLLVWRRRGEWRTGGWRCWTVAAIPLALAAGWYWRIVSVTGGLSGEQHGVALSRLGWAEKIALLGRVDWRNVADSAFQSHVWMGGWSFLVVRAWMYRWMLVVYLVALVGLVIWWRRDAAAVAPERRFRAAICCLLIGLFVGALAYHAAAIFAVHGMSAVPGWYLYGLATLECTLLALGWRRWVGLPVVSFAALEFFGLHFLQLPYYAGVIRYQDGRLRAARVADWFDGGPLIFERLAMNKPDWAAPWVLAGVWVLYAVALGAVLWGVARASRKPGLALD